MFLCYVDEAGCPGALPSADSSVQPVLVVAGLILPQEKLRTVTTELLALKSTFNPNMVKQSAEHLSKILIEVKGADLRRDIREGNRDQRRYAMRFMAKALDILERAQARIVVRLWIKKPAADFNGTAVYTSSIQWICQCFQNYLLENDGTGLVIADSRRPAQNVNVSHSIFTQKFRATGDPFERILETPTFGHSDNHACIQIADLLCSAFLFPIATHVYCLGHVQSMHVSDEYAQIVSAFSDRLKNIQYRYLDKDQRWRGGITVSDSIAQRSASEIFRKEKTHGPTPDYQPRITETHGPTADGD